MALPKNPKGPFGLPPHKPWYDRNYSLYVEPGTPLVDLAPQQEAQEYWQRYLHEVPQEDRAKKFDAGNSIGGIDIWIDEKGNVRRGGWRVGTATNKPVLNILRGTANAIARYGRSLGGIGLILVPTEAGRDAAPGYKLLPADAYTQEDALRDMSNYFPREIEAPNPVPPWMPGEVWVSPKTEDIELIPSPALDPYVPRQMPNLLPEVEVDTLPAPLEVPAPYRAPLWEPPPPKELIPSLSPPTAELSPKNSPYQPETMVSVEFEPDGAVRIRQRVRSGVRFQKRRRDSKYNRLWFGAMRFFSLTIGTWDEIGQFMDAVAWNATVPGKFKADGQPLPAMIAENGSALDVMQGIAVGKYDLDVMGAITDYALSQTMDALIGKTARSAQQGLNAAGWTREMGWQIGPADNSEIMRKSAQNEPEDEW